MPKRHGHKSDAVRELLTANPEVRNTEIIALLAAKKIKVTPALVSNLRKRMSTGGPLGKPGRPRKGAQDVSVASLVEAKRLADQLGGVSRTLDLLRILERVSG